MTPKEPIECESCDEELEPEDSYTCGLCGKEFCAGCFLNDNGVHCGE